MPTEERKNIINGLVRTEKGWVSIKEKIRIDARRRKKIEKGLVFFQGEWITIEEKIARFSRAKESPLQTQQPVVMNETFNQQTYTIYNDNRTTREDIQEHRHVHLEPGQIGRATEREIQGPAEDEITTPS
jgi:hypothetical protein